MEDPIELSSEEWTSTLTVELHQLREKGLFCDVVIQTSDNDTYSAHGNVLAAASPILSTYLQDKGLFVKFDDISADTWHTLLAFMYTGKVQHSFLSLEIVEVIPMMKIVCDVVYIDTSCS